MNFRFLILVLILIFLFIWILWGNFTIKTTKYSININNLESPLRIVQLSDLHNTNWGDYLVQKIKKENPDIIVITGDIFDFYDSDIEVVSNLVSNIIGIAPIYYVTGNHEGYFEDLNYYLQILSDLGIQILDGTYVDLNNSIRLIGISDPSITGFSNIELVLSENIDYNKYNIVLCHRPELFDVYVKCNANLVLTGHAHGGQFRVPFLGGLYVPNQGILPKYDAGKFERNDTKMIISCGLGNSVFPIRLNNRPELVRIEIY